MRAVPPRPGPSPHVVPTPAPAEAWADDLWNDHGQFVYSMACALVGDESAAMQAVAQGMVDLVGSDVIAPTDDTRRALARHVYRRTTHVTIKPSVSTARPPAMVWLAQLAQHQRAALALCAFGGFSYRDAAELLGSTPLAVAQLLSSGLAEIRRLSVPVIVT